MFEECHYLWTGILMHEFEDVAFQPLITNIYERTIFYQNPCPLLIDCSLSWFILQFFYCNWFSSSKTFCFYSISRFGRVLKISYNLFKEHKEVSYTSHLIYLKNYIYPIFFSLESSFTNLHPSPSRTFK